MACAIVTFLSTWGEAHDPLGVPPSLVTKALTVLIPAFVTPNYVDYGLTKAAGIVAILLSIILVFFRNRFLVHGLMAGTSK